MKTPWLYFTKTRELSWEEVLKKLGLQFRIKSGEKIAGLMKCVFHKERHASLTLFRNGFFHYFGCGESGDIFSFVRHRLRLSTKGTVLFFKREFSAHLPKNVSYAKKNHSINQEKREEDLFCPF